MEKEVNIRETLQNSFDVREIDSEQWRDYESLRGEMLQMDPEAFPPQAFADLDQPEEFWRSRIEQGSVLVAYDGIKPIGMVRATYDTDSAKLWNMYTKQEYRGRGLGKKLMTGIMDTVTNRGVASVTLEVEDTQLPARTMYEKVFGFHEVGREVNERGGFMLMMQRLIHYV